jgi:hypothetical protein
VKTTKLILPLLGAAVSVFASHFDGSRTIPVHRIPLTAEDGQAIVTTVPDTMPFSARMTCGACHDYETIHGGTHFKGAGQGRATEPWIVVDEKTGTQAPAECMDLSAWEFTKRFGSHLPGGAISDPEDQLADANARWMVSGGLEMNCMACHNQSHRQDMTEWAKQIARENFRWAATAAAGLGEVGGMASRMPDWWDPYAGGNPDDRTYRVPPSVNYDKALFDTKYRAWFDIGKPLDRNCLQCHSTHPVDAARMDVPGDVHAASGLSCVDCHRNTLDHQMLRGTTDAMSCISCHSEEGLHVGQAGAPEAHHKGLPPVHFKEMTCTTCHSGLAPGDAPRLIRTSRANRLGIYGRAQWYTESPFIVEPVFVRNPDGMIEPRRMMWPAFWADAEGNPLPHDMVEAAAEGILDTANQVSRTLAIFGSAENSYEELIAQGEPVFVAGGKAYAMNADGGLDLVGETGLNVAWGWDTGTNIISSIPKFDIHAEEVDLSAEDIILGIINAFSPLEVVVATGGRVFDLGDDGYLHGADTALEDGWYTRDGKALVTPFTEQAVVDIVGTTKAFNEAQVAAMLQKLGNGAGYIANGKRFDLVDGELTASDDEAAEPVSWPLAHDVRGTAQSLGARSCKECHAADSNFLFGSVTATGPLLTEQAKVVSMHEFMQLDEGYNKLFGSTFGIRKQFKWLLGNVALLLSLVGLAVGLPLLYKLINRLQDKPLPIKPVGLLFAAALIVLAVTGFGFGWPLSYPLAGFPLLTHVGIGALYAVLLLVLAVLRAREGTIWFWMLLISGIILILSVLIAMFPLLGTAGQHTAIIIHRVAAVVSIIAAVMECIKASKNKS